MTLEGGGGGGIGKAIGKVVSPVAKAATQAVQAVVQPVYNATLKQIPGVDKALVGLDKAVGSTIPGGWGTVAAIASSFIPGSQFGVNGLLSGITRTQLATGLGALSGSGVLKKGHEFNLQGAIVGGAMAYGGAKLSEGLQAAGQATPGGANAATEKALTEGSSKSFLEGTGSAAAEGSSKLTPTANALQNIATDGSNLAEYYKPPVPVSTPVPGEFVTPSAGEFGLKDVATGATKGMYNDAGQFVGGLNPAASTPNLLAQPPGMLDKLATNTGDLLKGMGSEAANAGAGIKNLAGFGAESGTAAAARNAFTNQFGLGAGTALVMGSSGLMALEEQKKALQEQLAAGTIAQQEYNQAMQAIEDQEKIARETVAANPFRTDTDVSGSLSGSGSDSPKSYETLYDAMPGSAGTLYANTPSREGTFAKGGEVQHYFGGGITAAGRTIKSILEGTPEQPGILPKIRQAISGVAPKSDVPLSGGAAQFYGTPSSWLPASALLPAPAIAKDKPTITIGIGSLNRGRPEDLLYDNSYKTSKSLNYELPKYALGGVIGDDYSGVGPLDQGFNFNYPQQNQVNSNYPSPSNFDRPQSGPTTPSSYYQNTGLDSLGGYGSGMGYAAGGYAMGGYAAGGEPRFLSGGGDGMSDSIKANINGNQEARLADGEFVVPADVVSHLGNGSSKAGAKQLYKMMDRVRTARTGRKSQGKQINPRKYMVA
jgi:hypothetical protein